MNDRKCPRRCDDPSCEACGLRTADVQPEMEDLRAQNEIFRTALDGIHKGIKPAHVIASAAFWEAGLANVRRRERGQP